MRLLQLRMGVRAVGRVLEDEQSHLNELQMLGVRFRRSDAARAVLSGVAFENCPSCTQSLPKRDESACPVCGQADRGADVSSNELDVAQKDAEARQKELRESIERRQTQSKRLRRDLTKLQEEKANLDTKLSEALKQYDSIVMSSLLAIEHRKATIEQEAVSLHQLRLLPARVTEMLASADLLVADELRVKRELYAAREEAERDAGNLRDLEAFFKDCLVRARLPGVGKDHFVTITAAGSFYPQVVRKGEEEVIVANHGNLSSGGKVTIFKCCFAIALHRLAAKVGAPLPRLLIIDTPMKNISERNNRSIFEAFYDMVYELLSKELNGTQVILIDKEFRPPPKDFSREMIERYMTPTDPKNPPLIRYFRE